MNEGDPIEDWGARIPAPRVLRLGSGLGFLVLTMIGAVVACLLAIVLGLSVMEAHDSPAPAASATPAAPASSDDVIMIDLGGPAPSSSADPR